MDGNASVPHGFQVFDQVSGVNRVAIRFQFAAAKTPAGLHPGWRRPSRGHDLDLGVDRQNLPQQRNDFKVPGFDVEMDQLGVRLSVRPVVIGKAALAQIRRADAQTQKTNADAVAIGQEQFPQ